MSMEVEKNKKKWRSGAQEQKREMYSCTSHNKISFQDDFVYSLYSFHLNWILAVSRSFVPMHLTTLHFFASFRFVCTYLFYFLWFSFVKHQVYSFCVIVDVTSFFFLSLVLESTYHAFELTNFWSNHPTNNCGNFCAREFSNTHT